MKQILNTWMSKPDAIIYYKVDNPVFSIGNWSIYKLYEGCYLYTFENISVNQLAGLNKDHLKALANDTKPTNDFLFNRAKKALKIGFELLTQ